MSTPALSTLASRLRRITDTQINKLDEKAQRALKRALSGLEDRVRRAYEARSGPKYLGPDAHGPIECGRCGKLLEESEIREHVVSQHAPVIDGIST